MADHILFHVYNGFAQTMYVAYRTKKPDGAYHYTQPGGGKSKTVSAYAVGPNGDAPYSGGPDMEVRLQDAPVKSSNIKMTTPWQRVGDLAPSNPIMRFFPSGLLGGAGGPAATATQTRIYNTFPAALLVYVNGASIDVTAQGQTFTPPITLHVGDRVSLKAAPSVTGAVAPDAGTYTVKGTERVIYFAPGKRPTARATASFRVFNEFATDMRLERDGKITNVTIKAGKYSTPLAFRIGERIGLAPATVSVTSVAAPGSDTYTVKGREWGVYFAPGQQAKVRMTPPPKSGTDQSGSLFEILMFLVGAGVVSLALLVGVILLVQ